MNPTIQLSHPTGRVSGTFQLPSSKSESNRALMIQAMSGGVVQLENLSDAADTQTLIRLLQQRGDGEMNVGHAGTVMRFMAAYLAFQPVDTILTGSDRMLERPIGPLVEALRQIGAEIEYMGNEGCPPLYIFGRNAKFGRSQIAIRGDISSQFISALLMVAPTLPEGLTLEIEGELISRPYVEMTLALMAQFGAAYTWEANILRVLPTGYHAGTFAVESDWSAAGYAYASAALAKEADLYLPGLKKDSLQGDSRLADIMTRFGITTTFTPEGIHLTKAPNATPGSHPAFPLSLIDIPDQAQTIVPMMAALGIKGQFTGLESLRVKETDRIAALSTELAKCGMTFTEPEKGLWNLEGTFQPPSTAFATYHDHRMAMGLAPLALVTPAVAIEDPQVVEKSFPAFWEAMEGIGFETK